MLLEAARAHAAPDAPGRSASQRVREKSSLLTHLSRHLSQDRKPLRPRSAAELPIIDLGTRA